MAVENSVLQETACTTDPVDVGSELRIPATTVSRGIGIGRAVFLKDDARPVKHNISADDVEAEIERLHRAVQHSLDEILELSSAPSPDSAADIFGIQSLILESSSLIPDIETEIRSSLITADSAIHAVSREYSNRQRTGEDTHIGDKYLDIIDVADRLVSSLGGAKDAVFDGTDTVFIVRELMPSRLMELSKSTPKAIIAEHGGWTSHSSILAREMKMPLVTGIKNIERTIVEGDIVIVDGVNGEVIVRPTDALRSQFSAPSEAGETPDISFSATGNLTRTADGVEIRIRVNTESPETYMKAAALGAVGVGLYRSETIFDRIGSFPDEGEQIAAYTEIAAAAGDFGVRIRTFDVGVGQLAGEDKVLEKNPSLGLRSIRLSLTDQTYFRTQIRAILQASANKKIDIVLPMISGVNEILRLRAIISEERLSLTERGITIGTPLIGAMIEVPSAVLTANEIAQNVDFLCLGTNDLVQYLLAVDRDNEAVADWYQTLHPAVIRSIRQVVDAADQANIPLNICGEVAGSPFYIPLLLGIGGRELSMNVNSILNVRRLISGITCTDASQLSDLISTCITADETEDKLRTYYLDNWEGLFPDALLTSQDQ